MALKVLLLRKKLNEQNAELAKLRTTQAGYAKREAELEKDIEAAATEEEKAAVEEAVTAFEDEKQATEDAIAAATEAIDSLTEQIDELETAAQDAAGSITGDTPPADDGGDKNRARGNIKKRGARTMIPETREMLHGIELRTLRAQVQRSDVTDFLQRVRDLMGQKRSVKGAELGIPETLLPILRDTTERYSKLYSHLHVTPLKGKARQNIAGAIPEAVWTEATAKLNELDIDFSQIEMDGYMVGGFVVIPNSTLEDDDNLELLATVIDYLGQAIGKAVDKAAVYGDGDKKPVGFVHRLFLSAKPGWWGSQQADFTDLHTSNVLKLDLYEKDGVAFFRPLIAALGKAKPNYSNGQLVWVMNRTTHMDLMARAMSWNSAATLLAGMDDTMPVIGGTIVELDFMADYDVAGGFMDLERWVERSGATIDYSDIPLFIQNCTTFKGLQRFDGKPVFGEAFVIVNYNNTEPVTSLSFAPDYNGDPATLVISAAVPASGSTTLTVSGVTGSKQMYLGSGVPVSVPKGAALGGSWTVLPTTKKVSAVSGNFVTVCDLDAAGRVIGVGAAAVPGSAG